MSHQKTAYFRKNNDQNRDFDQNVRFIWGYALKLFE